MKTYLCTICTMSLLFSACGDKPSHSTDAPEDKSSLEGKMLLVTELPPELIEGTPPPIILPLHTPMPN